MVLCQRRHEGVGLEDPQVNLEVQLVAEGPGQLRQGAHVLLEDPAPAVVLILPQVGDDAVAEQHRDVVLREKLPDAHVLNNKRDNSAFWLS